MASSHVDDFRLGVSRQDRNRSTLARESAQPRQFRRTIPEAGGRHPDPLEHR